MWLPENDELLTKDVCFCKLVDDTCGVWINPVHAYVDTVIPRRVFRLNLQVSQNNDSNTVLIKVTPYSTVCKSEVLNLPMGKAFNPPPQGAGWIVAPVLRPQDHMCLCVRECLCMYVCACVFVYVYMFVCACMSHSRASWDIQKQNYSNVPVLCTNARWKASVLSNALFR